MNKEVRIYRDRFPVNSIKMEVDSLFSDLKSSAVRKHLSVVTVVGCDCSHEIWSVWA